jgi:hypothetical protein
MMSITADSAIIESDYGLRILLKDKNDRELYEGCKDGDRIVAYFTLYEQTLPAGIDYIADISYSQQVLLTPILVYDTITDPTSDDSLGTDELKVIAMDVVKDYLNLSFSIYGGQAEHELNLARHAGNIIKDTIDLELRHQSNNDPGYDLYSFFVSFDLSSLRDTVSTSAVDSVILRIRANDTDDNFDEKYVKYKYTR